MSGGGMSVRLARRDGIGRVHSKFCNTEVLRNVGLMQEVA